MMLFMVYTPSQLLNAIVLASTLFSDKKCDVYYNKLCSKYFDDVHKPICFNECFEIEVIQDSYTGLFSEIINRIWNALKISTVLKTLPSNPKQYKKVFFSGICYRVYEIYYAIKKLNPGVELNLYEEGINEYYYLNRKSVFFENFFAKVFFHRFYMDDVKKVYVYNPSAVVYEGKLIDIKKIPNFYDSSKIKDIINQTFSYHETPFKDSSNQIVFLDQYYGSYVDDSMAMDKLQKEIISILINKFGYENVWVKLHPRSENEKYGTMCNYLDFKSPFELLILNENIEQNIFVSICSSCILNFKLIFDMEPYVFAFNKIAIKDKDINTLFSYVQNSYRTSKFFMPVNLEEFKKELNNI